MKPRERLLKILNLTVLTSVVIILVVIILGVGFINSSEKNVKISERGSPIIADPYSFGYNRSEENLFEISGLPVAECAADYCIDTEAGFMVVEYVIPDVLPLCITEDYLDSNFGITVLSYGGYHPDGMGGMSIYQPKTEMGGFVGINWIYVGSFLCDNPDLACYGCYVDAYVADFVLPDPIQIDSNHLPDVYTYGADWATMVDDPASPNLNKWVQLCLCTGWEGCGEPDQKFQLILAHYCLENPTSNPSPD